MVSRRAKYLLDDINSRIDPLREKYEERSEELVLQQENEGRQQAIEGRTSHDALMEQYRYKQNKHQNERVDPDKERVRNAEKVLGRMYARAYQRQRQRVREG